MNSTEIISLLPYSEPFLFVDGLDHVSENAAVGHYFFPEDSFFYKGHFADFPVTPGVILTECMAQIGLVCLGIFLLKDQLKENLQIAMSNTNIDFLQPVFPGEKVEVSSEKIYFRFNKLKCRVVMKAEDGKTVCKGEISGMIKSTNE